MTKPPALAATRNGGLSLFCLEMGTVWIYAQTLIRYDNHSYEHEHLDDLIVVCNKCHAKYHDKV